MGKIKEVSRTIQKGNRKYNSVICIISVLIILGSVFFFEIDLQKSKAESIITIVVICVLIILLLIYSLDLVEFHKFAFVFILFVGGLSLFIQPILNIPDEVAHFSRAEIVSQGQIIMDSDRQEYEAIQSVEDMKNNLKKSYIFSDLKGKKIDYDSQEVNHVAASNISYLYFPQAFGIIIAKVLRLDVIWLLWLGRFFNLLWYSFLVAFSIKLAPKLKFSLFFVATLPMSIQQAASYSPDATINGLSFLLIGYFLNLYCKKDIKITNKQFIVFWGIGILLTMAKVTDIFLVGLILLIPMEKFTTRKREILVKGLVIIGAIFVGGVYYSYAMGFPSAKEHQIYLESINVNSQAQIQYILNNILSWAHDFGASIINQLITYVGELNYFGWFEYSYPILTVIMLFMYGKICFQEEGIYIRKLDKFLVVLMMGGIYVASCLALYITWTPVGETVVIGMKGRY